MYLQTFDKESSTGAIAEIYQQISAMYSEAVSEMSESTKEVGQAMPSAEQRGGDMRDLLPEVFVPEVYQVSSLIEPYLRFSLLGWSAVLNNLPQSAELPTMLVPFSVAAFQSCFYCSEGYGTLLIDVWGDPGIVAQVINGDYEDAAIPPAHKAVIRWAKGFVNSSWAMNRNDVAALQGAGFDAREVVAIASAAAVQTWFSLNADGGGASPDYAPIVGTATGRDKSTYECTTAPAQRWPEPGEAFGAIRQFEWRVGLDAPSSIFDDVVTEMEDRYGFVPNLLRALSVHPESLPTWKRAIELLERPQSDGLSLRQHALVAARAAILNGSGYSVSTARARFAADRETRWVDSQLLALAQKSVPASGEQERLILDFVDKVVTTPYKVTCADIEDFRARGLDDVSYLEVLETVALQTALDRLANSLGVPPDTAPLLPR